MTRQLPLIEIGAPEWRLDEVTREIGRRGLAQARSALEAARARAASREAAGEASGASSPDRRIAAGASHANAA